VETPSSLADHGNGESPELARMNDGYHGHVYKCPQNQVYVHVLARFLGCGVDNLPSSYLGLPLGAPYKSIAI